jgi:hypothetical protein
MRDPTVAAVLSAIIPGVGQFYNGRFLAGILWRIIMIITPGFSTSRQGHRQLGCSRPGCRFGSPGIAGAHGRLAEQETSREVGGLVYLLRCGLW